MRGIDIHKMNSKTKQSTSRTELRVSGMSCPNCARVITRVVNSIPGVHNVNVDLETGLTIVNWAPGAKADVNAVITAIAQAGYNAEVLPQQLAGEADEPRSSWQKNLWIGIVCTALLAIGEWILNLSDVIWFRWLSFGLGTVVLVFVGARFYRGAIAQLKRFRSNMDTLVALGSTAAFGYSVFVLFAGVGDHLYFLEAAAIITIVTVGHWIEARVSARAATALKLLMHLAPERAIRRNPDGTETEVPITHLRPGDIVVLRPGDRIPADGVVIEGHSVVDESMLTGEANPAEKLVGSQLFAGTINLSGRLVQRVVSAGENTALANIIAAVKRAQTSHANIQRLADQVSNVFVPFVVLVAIGAWIWWALLPVHAHAVHEWLAAFLWHASVPESPLAAAFVCAAAVLIVACPCAMGLATPAAIMAAANAAATRGILIRDGVALEKAGQITTVIFDKTGTLTEGKPTVVEIWFPSGVQKIVSTMDGTKTSKWDFDPSGVDRKALELAASLARYSAHPISKAIAQLGKGRFEFNDVQEIPGAGVEGELKKNPFESWSVSTDFTPVKVRLGSIQWLEKLGVRFDQLREFIRKCSDNGANVSALAVNQTVFAAFALQDTLKPAAKDVVRVLTQKGLKVYLITGDTRTAAEQLATQIGISPQNVFAEVKSHLKADIVKRLQLRAERIAFIGDGINDAPAIEQADLGIAVSNATDITRQVADIVLLKSDLDAVPEALELARATLRIIKQNLFWAFFYNALSIPLAALGFLSPIICAFAMGVSDLLVVGNALRLLRFRGT